MLIKLYGEFWNPTSVDWGKQGPGNKGKLMGYCKGGQSLERDFWEARGIYVLYDSFRVVYVGQTQHGKNGVLGKRLRDHLTDRFAGRWDMFSWYSTSSLREKTVQAPGTRQVPANSVIDTLEAVCVAVAEPPLNRQRSLMGGAMRIEQSKTPHPDTVRHYLELIVAKLDSQAAAVAAMGKKKAGRATPSKTTTSKKKTGGRRR
jgi:hypothetical protein